MVHRTIYASSDPKELTHWPLDQGKGGSGDDKFKNTELHQLNCDTVSSEYYSIIISWWGHQMETFSALLAICAGNSPVHGEFPAQRPVTRSFDVFFDLRLNKRLSKQSWGWWFETLSRPLWRHCNDYMYICHDIMEQALVSIIACCWIEGKASFTPVIALSITRCVYSSSGQTILNCQSYFGQRNKSYCAYIVSYQLSYSIKT